MKTRTTKSEVRAMLADAFRKKLTFEAHRLMANGMEIEWKLWEAKNGGLYSVGSKPSYASKKLALAALDRVTTKALADGKHGMAMTAIKEVDLGQVSYKDAEEVR